jgi:hypothetical protein
LIEFERNFIDGQDGPEEDPYTVQKVRPPLVPRETQDMLSLRIWSDDDVTKVFLDDALSRLIQPREFFVSERVGPSCR